MPLIPVLRSALGSVLGPALGEGAAVDPILAVFADGTDGFYFDFSNLAKLWKDTAATTPVAAAGDSIARVDDSSPRGRNATQATSAAQPKYQTGGIARLDGSDDNLLTTLNPGPEMTIGFKGVVTTGGRVVISSRTASDLAEILVTAAGLLGGSVGSLTSATITGGGDIRGVVGVNFLTFNGSEQTLYRNGTPIYTGPRAGTVPTTVPFAIGGRNNSGVMSNFADADIYHALAIKKALTAAEIAAITNKWGTS